MKNFNKKAQGIVSFATIIILLVSILASSIYLDYSITANAVKENAVDNKPPSVQVREVKNAEELNYLNEGWYEIKSGYAYYLESFNDYVPLYIQVTNPQQQNGLLVIDADGTIYFDDSFRGLPRSQVVADEKEEISGNEETTQNEQINQNHITGKVTGMERVSGFAYQDLVSRLRQGATTTGYQQGSKNFIVIDTLNNKVDILSQAASEEQIRNSLKNDLKDKYNPNVLRFYPIDVYQEAILSDVRVESVVPETIFIQLESPYRDAIYYNPQTREFLNNEKKPVIKYRSESVGTGAQQKFEVHIEDNLETRRSTINVPSSGSSQLIEAEIPTNLADTVIKRLKEGYSIQSISETPNQESATFLRELGQGTPAHKIDQLVAYADGTAISTTQSGAGTTLKTIKVTKNPDGSTITIDGKTGSTINNIDQQIGTVTMEKGGKKIQLDPNAYEDINKKIGNDGGLLSFFADEAIKLGISKIDVIKTEGNVLIVGDERGTHIRLFDQKRIASMKGEDVVAYIDNQKLISATFEGKAQLHDNPNNPYTLSEGSTAIVKELDDKGNLKSDKIEQQTKDYLVIGEYIKKDETQVTIKDGTKTIRTYTISNKPETEGLFVGMRKVTYGDKDIYLDESGGGVGLPFGLGGAKFYLQENGVKKEIIIDSELNAILLNLNKKRESKGEATFEQSSSQSFFSNVERVFSEFSGLKYYDTLFFDEDSLLKWRDNVDRMFATLYLGTEYWSSALCSTYLDGQDDGIAYAETPQGLAQIGAHVEAIRTGAVQTGTGTEFIYRITFSVRNGDFANDPRAPNEMNFNVILKGEKTANVFKQEQKVKRGSTFSRTGKDAIVQESPVFYNQVCMRFDEIPLRWKLDDKELCNTIVESGGEAAPLAASAGTAAAASSGSGASGSGINDF